MTCYEQIWVSFFLFLQLENAANDPGMTKISDNEMDEFVHQAVDRDYAGSGYTRGHVFPRQYAADKEDRDSTFTFTNAAPQREHNNQIWAAQAETRMKKDIEAKCVVNSPKAPGGSRGSVDPHKKEKEKSKWSKHSQLFLDCLLLL